MIRVRGMTERLALVGLLQVAGVAAGLYLVHEAGEPHRHSAGRGPAVLLAASAAEGWDDHVALATRLAASAKLLEGQIELTDAQERPLLKVGTVQGEGRQQLRTAEVVRDGKTLGHVHVSMVWQRSSRSPQRLLIAIAIALSVVGVGSWLLSRMFVRPLERLAGAARRLGEGDLTARSGLHRSDEIGELAGTFDAMAGRVQGLVTAQAELVAGVSHELRTPLARIRVALDLAQEGAMLERDVLSEINTDLGELEHMVADMLTVARLRLTQNRAIDVLTHLPRAALDLRTVAAEAAERFRARMPKIQLAQDISAEAVSVQGSSMLLRRALDNLLDNAAHHGGGAAVSLRCWGEEGQVCLEVRDQGPGIRAEEVARIFEPFYRSDPSRARSSGGLGLGLTLTRRIVEAHGGRVTLESQAGQGTTVRIALPTRDGQTVT